jgi:hypothetical protein
VTLLVPAEIARHTLRGSLGPSHRDGYQNNVSLKKKSFQSKVQMASRLPESHYLKFVMY